MKNDIGIFQFKHLKGYRLFGSWSIHNLLYTTFQHSTKNKNTSSNYGFLDIYKRDS